MLAVVPQRSNLDRSLSIRRNLTFHAAYHGVPAAEAAARADELLEQFGLRERGDVKPDLFSGGQSQRVMIARALMHEPQVLFLDEPTTGLDPAARLFVWDRLRELRERGVTLILTTHDMHEAALLADRVGIMDHGKLLALDTPEALMRGLPGQLDARAERARRRQRALAGDARSTRSRRCPGSSGSSRCPRDRRRSPTTRSWRVRLYVVRRGVAAGRADGDAARRARSQPQRRRARGADARGRVHPSDRADAAMTAAARRGAVTAPAIRQRRAFTAVLRRDLLVTWSELPVFLAQVILQPLFLLFVFGKVLGSLGYTQHGYSDLLFPGLLALTAVITGMQTLAFPLVIEFGWTKEIEDRLLAPMSTALVAAEKVLFATLRALTATTVMIPVGILVLGSIPWRWSGVPLLVLAMVLGSLLGAGLGLVLGHAGRPAADQHRVLARVHAAAVHRLQPVPVAVAVAPALVPGRDRVQPDDLRERGDARGARPGGPAHHPVGLHRRARRASLTVLMTIGVRGFYRRAID